MGSFVSQPLEPVKGVAPPEVASSANPAPVIAPGAPTSPAEAPLFNNCWSCRVLSGSGLIGAGGYVYWAARKPMKLGYPPGPGTIAQMVFGISESSGHYPWAGGRGERGRRGAHPRGRGRGARVGHVAAGVPPTPPPKMGVGRKSCWEAFLSFFLNHNIFLRTLTSLNLFNLTKSY